MPILPKEDLLAAMYLGLIQVDGQTKINATSVDVHLGQLLTPAIKREEMKDVPLIDNKYWLIKPGDFFLYETAEKFSLAYGFNGAIHSRSSWARCGSASKDMDDSFYEPFRKFEGKVICTLHSLGTTFILRPGDALAQAHLAFEGFAPLTSQQMAEAVKKGLLEVTYQGKKINRVVQPYYHQEKIKFGQPPKGSQVFNSGGFTLTCDSVIKIYNGQTIDPHDHQGHYFDTVELGKKGQFIKKGTFFLSASAEEVKINERFVGWVDESNHLFINSGYRGPGLHPYEQPSFLQTHASAPKIDPFPVFSGKITFENYALEDLVIKPGQRITELYLFWLNNPCSVQENEYSRYKGQKEALAGKTYLDKKVEQLTFDFMKL